MPRIDPRAARSDRVNHEALRWLTCHFHPGRAQRHSANSKASYASRLGRKHPPHVLNRDVTFEGQPVDQGGMAGAKVGWNSIPCLKRRTVGGVSNPDGLA